MILRLIFFTLTIYDIIVLFLVHLNNGQTQHTYRKLSLAKDAWTKLNSAGERTMVDNAVECAVQCNDADNCDVFYFNQEIKNCHLRTKVGLTLVRCQFCFFVRL